MPQNTDHRRGVLLALSGVLVLSPDGLLIRLISTDDWTLLFWRGLLTSLTLMAVLSFKHKKNVGQKFTIMRKKGLFAGTIQALGTIFFVLAITHTSVANTLIIIGVTPLWAAIFSHIFLSEKIHLRTWLAIPMALLGIYITANAEIQANTGDIYAIVASIFISGHGVIVRSAKPVDFTPCLVIGGLFIAAFGLLHATPFAISKYDVIYLALLGFLVLPLSFGLLVAAPRYLPAPEVNLIFLLEIVFGSYWVWLVLGEQPSPQAFIGGSIILITLVIHTYLGFRANKN
jgi:drug/metabolite transporter (DMT)-like permease